MNIHEKFFSKIGLNYAILGISAIIIQIVLLNIIGILHADLLSDFNILVILTSLCNYILPFPIFYFLMRKIASQKLEKHPLDIKIFLLYFAISITLSRSFDYCSNREFFPNRHHKSCRKANQLIGHHAESNVSQHHRPDF